MENEGWGGTKLAEDMCERIIIKPNVATIPNPAYLVIGATPDEERFGRTYYDDPHYYQLGLKVPYSEITGDTSRFICANFRNNDKMSEFGVTYSNRFDVIAFDMSVFKYLYGMDIPIILKILSNIVKALKPGGKFILPEEGFTGGTVPREGNVKLLRSIIEELTDFKGRNGGGFFKRNLDILNMSDLKRKSGPEGIVARRLYGENRLIDRDRLCILLTKITEAQVAEKERLNLLVSQFAAANPGGGRRLRKTTRKLANRMMNLYPRKHRRLSMRRALQRNNPVRRHNKHVARA